MQPSIDRLVREGWAIHVVDAVRDAQRAKEYQVTKVPTIVIVSEGRVVDRIDGAIGYDKLKARLSALAQKSSVSSADPRVAPRSASPASGISSNATVRGQSPAPLASFPLLNSAAFGELGSTTSEPAAFNVAAGADTAMAPMETATAPAHGLANPNASANPQSFSTGAFSTGALSNSGAFANQGQASNSYNSQPAQAAQRSSLTPSPQAIAQAADATVRIRIEDGNSISFGTGTVISTHNGQALALTCGHMFRDMRPEAQMTVDLFRGGRAITMPAQLVSFDAKDRDIGLIEFRPSVPVTPVPIARMDASPAIGDVAFSYGCDHGADPTRRDTQIKRLNRFLGAANVEIVGAPVVGRSGGGLFNAQGQLIGVCNAADEDDDEGIYAALPVIHEHTAALKLDELMPAAAPMASLASNPNSTPPVSPASFQTPSQQPNPVGQTANAMAQGANVAWPDQTIGNQAIGNPLASSNMAAAPNTANAPVQMLQCVVRDANGQESMLTIQRPSAELMAALRQQSMR